MKTALASCRWVTSGAYYHAIRRSSAFINTTLARRAFCYSLRMNIVVDPPSVNPAAASLARAPAMPAPSSSMSAQALKAANEQGRLTPPKAPVEVPSPRAVLPTDAEKMVQQYEQVVEQLNRQMQANNRNLGFGIDRKINTFVITVTDKRSGDVVRQIPAEAVVRVAHAIEDLKGVLYSAEA